MEPGVLSFWNMLQHGYWCTYVGTDIHNRSLFNGNLCLDVIYWHNWAKHNISQLFGLGLDLSLKCLASDSGAFRLVYNLCLAVFLCQSSCLTHADGDNHILLMYKLRDDIANSSRLHINKQTLLKTIHALRHCSADGNHTAVIHCTPINGLVVLWAALNGTFNVTELRQLYQVRVCWICITNSSLPEGRLTGSSWHLRCHPCA